MVSLSLIVTSLTLTLNRSRVISHVHVRVNREPCVIFNRTIGTRYNHHLIRGLISRAVRLLLVVQELLKHSKLRAFTLIALHIILSFIVRLLNLHLPHRAPVLYCLPYNLLVSRNAFRASGHNIGLYSRVTILTRVGKRILGIVLNRVRTLTIVRDVNTLRRDIRLDKIVPPLTLTHAYSTQLTIPFAGFLHRQLFSLLLSVGALPRLCIAVRARLAGGARVRSSMTMLPISFYARLARVSRPLPGAIERCHRDPCP